MRSFLASFIVIVYCLLVSSACVPQESPGLSPMDAVNQISEPSTAIPITTTPIPVNTEVSKPLQPISVRLAWFYKPPRDGNMAPIASIFNIFILTKGDETQRDQLIQLGVAQPILQYMRFDVIQDPGSCSAQPWRNQVAYLPGDFCRISTDHPDWFLLNKNGSRINQSYENQNFYTMNLSNPGWREFWLQRTRQSQIDNAWQGVFLDNVGASLDKLDQISGGNGAYKTDADYQDAVNSFLEYIYKSYFQPQNRPLFANIIDLKDHAVWSRYLHSLDGAMLENFAVGWKSDKFRPQKWEADMNLAELTQAQGKQVILISQGDRNDIKRQKFAIASYLLISNGLASFRYASADSYEDAWIYDNYSIKLGLPLGSRFQVGDTLWRRDFQNGSIVVDLASRSAEIIVK
jgi:hypothetical protein